MRYPLINNQDNSYYQASFLVFSHGMGCRKGGVHCQAGVRHDWLHPRTLQRLQHSRTERPRVPVFQEDLVYMYHLSAIFKNIVFTLKSIVNCTINHVFTLQAIFRIMKIRFKPIN